MVSGVMHLAAALFYEAAVIAFISIPDDRRGEMEIDAFIYDATVLEYWTSRDDGCKLKTVGNLYAMTGYGIGFPKGSRWLPKINSRILHYQKNGKFHRWKQFWLSGACKKVSTTLGNTNKTLGVKNFISAFILLLCGMLLCGVMFVMEHVFYGYIWRRIQASDHYGCCALAVVKPKQTVEMGNEVLGGKRSRRRKRRPSLKDERHREECTNTACVNERYRSRQEIAKLSRHLGFLMDEVSATTNEVSADRLRRSDVGLPSSAIILAQRSHANTAQPCTVIRIPRTSWSKENYVNRNSHPIHSVHPSPQHLQMPPSSLRSHPRAQPVPTPDLVGEGKIQAKLESCGGSEGCRELASFPHSTTSRNTSPASQTDMRTVNERVEKESVI
ncbi:Glutamate receptor ionotropic NMDA 2A [Taenia solium]|eukprot:TsM_000364000 transcript=TsM_000364000 gene=TsM_000364000